MAGLYFHIPFCLKKCPYCGFASGVEAAGERQRFLQVLKREMEIWAADWRDLPFHTLYLGGGTPSLLEPTEVGAILEQARKCFALDSLVEVSIEANPGTVSLDKLKGLREVGINRLSLGFQAFQDDLLQRIGRIHSVQNALQSFYWAREAGFGNLSIDLMFALPGQTLEEWEDSLCKAFELRPEHISLYGLTLEAETAMKKWVDSGHVHLPGEKIEAQMYERAGEILGQAGYEHYEISNFARTGFRSRHNSGYWSGEPYLGLGPSAHSFRGTRRWANASSFRDYVDRVALTGKAVVMEESLTLEQQRLERIFLGFRQKEGISLNEYETTFDESLETRFRERLPSFLNQGWVVKEAGSLRLSERGMALADAILKDLG